MVAAIVADGVRLVCVRRCCLLLCVLVLVLLCACADCVGVGGGVC